jgi:5,5'-dehydrodivanillate O-demethylase
LLGEDLVLFRDQQSRLGLITEQCPHRRASLAFGIPTKDGSAAPTRLGVSAHAAVPAPAERAGKERVPPQGQARRAYPVEEMGGMIWAYLGPADKQSLLPRIDGFVSEGAVRMCGRALIPVNWLQIMENSLDPIHTEWLHGHTYEFIKEQQGNGHKVAISARHEKIAFREFEHGITKHRLLAGHSEDSDDWKVGHPVVFPNILSVGNGDETSRYYAFQIRVPADDTHTLHLWYTAYMPPKGAKVRSELLDKVHVYDVPLKDERGRIHSRQHRRPGHDGLVHTRADRRSDPGKSRRLRQRHRALPPRAPARDQEGRGRPRPDVHLPRCPARTAASTCRTSARSTTTATACEAGSCAPTPPIRRSPRT